MAFEVELGDQRCDKGWTWRSKNDRVTHRIRA